MTIDLRLLDTRCCDGIYFSSDLITTISNSEFGKHILLGAKFLLTSYFGQYKPLFKVQHSLIEVIMTSKKFDVGAFEHWTFLLVNRKDTLNGFSNPQASTCDPPDSLPPTARAVRTKDAGEGTVSKGKPRFST